MNIGMLENADTSTSSVELQNDEECDATDDAQGTAAGHIKKSQTP